MEHFKDALEQYTDFVKILKVYGITTSTCETDVESKQLRISCRIHDSDVEHIGHTANYVYEMITKHSNLLNAHFKIKSNVYYNEFFNTLNIAINWANLG